MFLSFSLSIYILFFIKIYLLLFQVICMCLSIQLSSNYRLPLFFFSLSVSLSIFLFRCFLSSLFLVFFFSYRGSPVCLLGSSRLNCPLASLSPPGPPPLAHTHIHLYIHLYIYILVPLRLLSGNERQSHETRHLSRRDVAR